jgi:hypothetical protein
LALANATVESSFTTFPGRWTTSDSILSSSERVSHVREYFVYDAGGNLLNENYTYNHS